MDAKAKIRELAISVDAGFTVYLSVHKKIFQEQATLWSRIRNFFGRGAHTGILLKEAESLVPLWHDIHAQVVSFQLHALSLSRREACYVDILSHYVKAVQTTVATLVVRQRLCNERSQRGPKHPKSLHALRQSQTEYEAAVKAHSALRDKLNAAAPLVFS